MKHSIIETLLTLALLLLATFALAYLVRPETRRPRLSIRTDRAYPRFLLGMCLRLGFVPPYGGAPNPLSAWYWKNAWGWVAIWWGDLKLGYRLNGAKTLWNQTHTAKERL